MSRLWNLMIRQLKSVLIWPKLPQTLCQIFEIEDWFNISSYNLFQVAMTSFFLFPTLLLMCILWWDAYLHNREVPATNLASDCRRPVVSQFPLLFLGIPFSVRHSTELITDFCSFHTKFKGLDCYRNFSFSADTHSSLLKEPHISSCHASQQEQLGIVAQTIRFNCWVLV